MDRISCRRQAIDGTQSRLQDTILTLHGVEEESPTVSRLIATREHALGQILLTSKSLLSMFVSLSEQLSSVLSFLGTAIQLEKHSSACDHAERRIVEKVRWFREGIPHLDLGSPESVVNFDSHVAELHSLIKDNTSIYFQSLESVKRMDLSPHSFSSRTSDFPFFSILPPITSNTDVIEEMWKSTQEVTRRVEDDVLLLRKLLSWSCDAKSNIQKLEENVGASRTLFKAIIAALDIAERGELVEVSNGLLETAENAFSAQQVLASHVLSRTSDVLTQLQTYNPGQIDQCLGSRLKIYMGQVHKDVEELLSESNNELKKRRSAPTRNSQVVASGPSDIHDHPPGTATPIEDNRPPITQPTRYPSGLVLDINDICNQHFFPVMPTPPSNITTHPTTAAMDIDNSEDNGPTATNTIEPPPGLVNNIGNTQDQVGGIFTLYDPMG
ncbi:hypothetical protein FRC02_007196 [Tulasnella sp. 418]|nr:hypothetical protein FRC02_007196 [Tulasnella sp. 418]